MALAHCILGDTVGGRNPTNQLRLVVYPIIYRVFIHPRWFRISSLNRKVVMGRHQLIFVVRMCRCLFVNVVNLSTAQLR